MPRLNSFICATAPIIAAESFSSACGETLSPTGEREFCSESELAGEAVILRQRLDLVPGRILDLDAVLAAVLLAAVLDLAGIEDAARPFRGRCFLQVFDELADLLLEFAERAERIDLEARHKAAVIVPAGRLDPKAEPGQEAAQDLDHDGEAGALVAAVGAAQRQQRATLA